MKGRKNEKMVGRHSKIGDLSPSYVCWLLSTSSKKRQYEFVPVTIRIPAIRHDILDFCERELVTFGKGCDPSNDLLDTICCFVSWMPIGYLMRLEHSRISIEIRVSQAYNVMNG